MNYFKAEPNLLISSCLLQKAPKPATRIFILSCAPPLISFAPLSHFTLQAALFSYLLNRTLCKMRSLPALAGDSQDYKTFLS